MTNALPHYWALAEVSYAPNGSRILRLESASGGVAAIEMRLSRLAELAQSELWSVLHSSLFLARPTGAGKGWLSGK